MKPNCPHCDHQFDDDQVWHGSNNCEFPTERDGDTGEFDCPNCGEPLYVRVDFSPAWYFTDENGIEI